jgi:hypothetical protein
LIFDLQRPDLSPEKDADDCLEAVRKAEANLLMRYVELLQPFQE